MSSDTARKLEMLRKNETNKSRERLHDDIFGDYYDLEDIDELRPVGRVKALHGKQLTGHPELYIFQPNN